MSNGGPCELIKHRTEINKTQYSGKGDATLCIVASNTTEFFFYQQNFLYHFSPIDFFFQICFFFLILNSLYLTPYDFLGVDGMLNTSHLAFSSQLTYI